MTRGPRCWPPSVAARHRRPRRRRRRRHHDERRRSDAGAGRRPRLLLPPRASTTRRGSSWSAAAPDRDRRRRSAASPTPAWSREPDPRRPGRPRADRLASAACLVTNRANPVPRSPRAAAGHRRRARDRLEPDPGLSRTDPIVPVGLGPDTGAGRSSSRCSSTSARRWPTAPSRWPRRPRCATTSSRRRPRSATSTRRSPAPPRGGLRGGRLHAAHDQERHVPGRRPLGMVTRGKPRGALARFLRWARTSPKARQVIRTRYLDA